MTSEPDAPRPTDSSPSRWRSAVRGLAVAAGFIAIAEIGALVLSEYVGTAVFSWLLPGLLGAGSGELASTVSYPIRRPRPAPAVRAIVAAAGIAAPVVATVQAFRIADIPYGPSGRWLPPVLTAITGAVLMWLLPLPGARGGRPTSEAGPRAQPAVQRRSSGTDDDL